MAAPAYVNHAYTAAAGNPLAMTLPGSRVTGNTLLALVRYAATGTITGTFTPPSGWDVLHDDYHDPGSAGRVRMWTMTRIIDGSETSTVNVTAPNFVQTGMYAVCAQISGLGGSTPTKHESGGLITADGSINPVAITTTGPDRLGILWFTHINDNSVPGHSFTGWTNRDERWQFEWDNDTQFGFFTRDLSTAGTYDPESVATAGRNTCRTCALYAVRGKTQGVLVG